MPAHTRNTNYLKTTYSTIVPMIRNGAYPPRATSRAGRVRSSPGAPRPSNSRGRIPRWKREAWEERERFGGDCRQMEHSNHTQNHQYNFCQREQNSYYFWDYQHTNADSTTHASPPSYADATRGYATQPDYYSPQRYSTHSNYMTPP